MKKQNNKKGIVLVSTMLLLTVIIMTGIMLAISAYSNMKISRTYNSIARAQYMAESGTEYIRSIFYQNADFMYHQKHNDKGSVNKKTIFESSKNSEEITITIDYENRWIKGTLTEKNGQKTYFRAGFCDSTSAPNIPIDDDYRDKLPPIKYLSCNNFPSDRYGYTFELLNDKYIAREINGQKTKISPGTAYLVVEGRSGDCVKYLESYLEKTKMNNYVQNNKKSKLQYGMTEESSIFTSNVSEHNLPSVTKNYASLKQNSFLYSNMSYMEYEHAFGNIINVNLQNLKNKQIGQKINSGAYFLIDGKIFFVPKENVSIDKNGNILSNKKNAVIFSNKNIFEYDAKNNEIKTGSLICNGDLIISEAEYVNDEIISKNSTLKLSINNSRLFVNGKKFIINGEVIGDGMIYSAGEITIGTSYFLKNKKYYPMIIAEKNIIVLPPTTDSIFVGYEKYREELWHNFIQSEKENVLTTKNIPSITKKILATKATLDGESIDLKTALKRSNLKFTEEEINLYALLLIELNSIMQHDEEPQNHTENNSEELYSYKTKIIPTIKLKTKITEKGHPLKNEIILFADIVSLNGDIKSEKGTRLTIFGIVEICDTNNESKMFFNYLYDPNEEIFISKGKGVQTRYKFRNIF